MSEPVQPIQPASPCVVETVGDRASEAIAAAATACVSQPQILASGLSSRSNTPQSRQPRRAAPSPSLTTPPSSRPDPSAKSQPLPLLKSGSQGAAVVQLQQQLRQLGYGVGAIDGRYGPRTQAAVGAFQRARRLVVDGITGPSTWAALQQAMESRSAAALAGPAAARPILPSGPAPQQDAPPAAPTPAWQQPAPGLFSPEVYPWILGWSLLYGGGWMIILRGEMRKRWGDRAARSDSNLPAPPAEAPRAVAVKAIAPPAKATAPAQTDSSVAAALHPELAPVADQAACTTGVKSADRVPVGTAEGERLRPVPGLSASLEPAGLPIEDLIASIYGGYGYGMPPAPPPPPPEKEVAIASFAPEEQGIPYVYSLLNDANGLFVLRGHDLWMRPQRLSGQGAVEKTVVLRRTDPWGRSSEQTFRFQIQQPAQAAA